MNGETRVHEHPSSGLVFVGACTSSSIKMKKAGTDLFSSTERLQIHVKRIMPVWQIRVHGQYKSILYEYIDGR